MSKTFLKVFSCSCKTETDGPYMAPLPYRGKVSHCGYIPIIAEKIASIHGINDVESVLEQCRKNAKKMYGV